MLRLFRTMPKQIRAYFRWSKRSELTAGKITLFAVLTGAILSATTFATYFDILVPMARASTVSTTVTVLNTPPQWDATGHAHESTPSATSTPTNVGNRLSFEASATDSNSDSY